MESTKDCEPNLLQQLDDRQNHVLSALDELNHQIESTLAAWQRQDNGVSELPRADKAA